MVGISDYPAFAGAVVVFLAITGPGNLALLTATATGGRKRASERLSAFR